MIAYPFFRFVIVFLLAWLSFVPSQRLFGQWRMINRCADERGDTIIKQGLKEIQQYLNKNYRDLVNEGYLECHIDTTSQDSSVYYCVHKGKQYTIDSVFILQANHTVSVKAFSPTSSTPFSKSKMTLAGLNPLEDYLENGFPFASLRLDTVTWRGDVAQVHWRVDKGRLVRMDSLYIRGEERIPHHFLRRSLQWQKGKLFKESICMQADERIRQSAFLKTEQPSALRFTSSGAQLIVYPSRKPSNTFQGILGIRPDDLTGKINLTGDVELRLWNSLNTGEELYLNWRKLQSQTQDLEAKAGFSYLFGTAFGPDALLKIYKRDSTFVSVKMNGGMSWKPNSLTAVRGFAERFTSTILKPSFLFPESSNISAIYYGMSCFYNALDNANNPRKGVTVKGEVAMGKRMKEVLNIVDSETRMEGYDALRAELEFKFFIPTFKKQCVMLGNYSSTLQTDSIAQNEMYRIGGLRSMRGIDEESILATSFTITTLEYRYLVDEQTAVYLFTDQSWWEKKSIVGNDADTPYSFGAGLILKTGSGVFTFNYALAKQFNNPILVKNAKVSFGFRSVF